MQEKPTRRLNMLGLDGLMTLLISNLAIVFTLGLSLIPPMRRVYRTAKAAPCTVPAGRFLLVMGSRLENDRITTLFRQRLDRALALSKGEKELRILLLGGITGNNRFSEAEMGRRYLLRNGVDPDQVMLEDQSRHTLENLKHARSLIASRVGSATLLSNRFHLARCSALARGLGMEHELCAAEQELRPSLAVAAQLLLEAYYLHWYEAGKRWSRWTRNEKSLERIS
jgi:uncharacterized SAM-binding protein YcdF (DUF218 family)